MRGQQNIKNTADSWIRDLKYVPHLSLDFED